MEKTYRERDLIALGFALFEKTKSTPTLFFAADIHIDGNIDVPTANLELGGNFCCSGFIRAKNINSSASIFVSDFISCQEIAVRGNLTVNGNLLYSPRGITCDNLLTKGRVDCGHLIGNTLSVNGKVDALEIKAKKIKFQDIVNATSIEIED